jgi:hypothetical protein
VAEEKAHQWTLRALGDGSPHASQNSGVSEWYTPDDYIQAARNVTGSIDTNPATTEAVNERIEAELF